MPLLGIFAQRAKHRPNPIGVTSVRLESDAVLFTEAELFDQLVVTFGGLAAEDLVLGAPSTGAEQDVEHATQLARELVGRYGMSERIGRVRLLAADADEYLGTSAGLASISERTHELFDDEVRRILDAAETRAKELVGANRAVLDRLAATLLDREMLEGAALAERLAPVRRAEA